MGLAIYDLPLFIEKLIVLNYPVMLKPLYLCTAIMVLPITQEIVDAPNSPVTSTTAFHVKPALQQLSAPAKQVAEPDVNGLKQGSWYTEAMKNLQQKEYAFNKEADSSSYSTPNRNNNLRFYYTNNGFTVQPRSTQIPIGEPDATKRPDEIKYKNLPDWKVSFNLDKKQVGVGEWQVAGNKAEYKTGHVTVQYINSEEGMRQNFIVQSPLTRDSSDLKLHFNIETALQQRLQNDRIQFVHKKSGVVLNYDQLKVWDANGRPLEASFEKSNRDYCIHVHSQYAAYPITIDPLSSTAAAMVESNQASANLGKSVASAGDVNGDGYSDVIVGASLYDNGSTNEGAAFIYHGSASGISTTAAAMVESDQTNAYLGFSVAGAGDVNGDGYSDVIVGAIYYDNGSTSEGAAFVYHGSASGIITTAAAQVESNQANAYMGYSVAGAGDVNGDGYSDVIAGAYQYDNGDNNEGAAFVYHGSASGISTTAAAMVESNQANALLGVSVAGAGDVNGDGYSDVIVGAYGYDNGENNEGAAFVYHGSVSGISTTAVATVESNQATAWLGYSVAGAGDVNGDGYSDVIVGACLYDNGSTDEGAAFIYHGSASGISTTAAARVESDQATAYMGYSVACAGDVNGDGYSDVIVGVRLYDNGSTDEGAAFIYQGSATGISTTAATIVESNQANANMGLSVASAGDVNGDGYSDVIVGAYLYDNGSTDEGAAFVYHGSASGINTTAAARMESNQVSAYLGYSVASAGDVNGDGYSDVIVGAPYYNNGSTDEGAAFIYHGSASGISTTAAAMVESNQADAYLGCAVAGAGDVNGDGYSDVIVGAYYYDNGSTNEGAAFIYHGSASGISTTAAARVESNQANALMGWSVAGAGDINGDGYSDVIVGVLYYSNGSANEGAAFIYHGSASGISTTAATSVESNQTSAFMGISVAGAGDVNGDGYSDVIVGAYMYDNGENNEGAAFIYHGSATGISTTAAARVESNQAGAYLGFSVASAGDVNGDGYSDVIAGAYYYDNGENNEGAAFIYHGSASGISATAAAMVESNLADVALGYSVAGAGDVNGDGYSDVIAGVLGYGNGQSNEGAAFIYHGSASGISTTTAAIVESNQVNAGFSLSVAGAGDVNGDGYSDVIVGAWAYDNGSNDEGASFVYYGNSPGINKRNNLRLYNTDLTTPVNSSNFGNNLFGAGLFGKSFTGRTKGKLVWETRTNYAAYSGAPITNSVLYASTQGSYTDLGTAGIELKYQVAKALSGRYTKIRARVKYDLVTAITGQVYGPWRYVPEIVSTASLGVLPVNLISFNAAWMEKGKTAQITFVTEDESQVCCYDIEKSSDGVNFTKTGAVTATNTAERTTYNFTDYNAAGNKLYYRLKTINSNGAFEYSNIQWLQNNTATEILVFPNPATSTLQLQLNNSYSNMRVEIINSAGQTVTQFNNLSTAGQIVTIPVSQLATGTYFLSLQSGSEKQVLQFVKQ
jgi:hypothetical protein